MLSSLEVIKASGISRATLNNYIALGLLPRPQVRNPGHDSHSRARQIGYFPQDAIDRIERIKLMKKEGMTVADVVKQLSHEGFEASQAQPFEKPLFGQSFTRPSNFSATQAPLTTPSRSTNGETGPLRLTVDKLPCAAYMLNYNLELAWYNEEARISLFGSFESLPADTKDRSVFDFFTQGAYGRNQENREALRQMHQQMGRERNAREFSAPSMGVGEAAASPISDWPLDLISPDGERDHYHVYASRFREGVLVIFDSATEGHGDVQEMLERRDDVIRNLLKKRVPVLTDVAVMVADLQGSVRICSELPPEEYFELINQIWATMEPIFRRYYGTHGKHAGDGMVYYFFPQPDSNYVYNALCCADQIREAMRKISKEWQLRKNWLNELYLNTGLNEGHEWLGVFQIETKIEFTVLGDTINLAARLSDLARQGGLWATKNLMGKLTPDQRNKIRFGVRRQDQDKHEIFVKSSYSRVSELVDLNLPRCEKLRDISALAVTEIVEVG
ncbi:MAG: adenylate/guanylate cyclase domain-containing protein [Rhodoferax sp.]